MIEIKNVSKVYGKIRALNNISLTVNKGEILGFLGPNGAGKSTTMKIITGFISPSEGTVVVDGFDILDNDIEVKKRIGYLPENPPLYNDMTVESYLKFVGELKGLQRANLLARVNEVMAMTSLIGVKGRLIQNLSKGYKQRVGLAQAILGNPDVLILDEPTVGLDPTQILEIRQLIKRLGEDRTIILSTHILPEVSQICDRVIIINNGEIIAVDTPENLSNKVKHSNIIEVRIIGPLADVLEKIKGISGVVNVEMLGEKEKGTIDYSIETQANVDIRAEIFNVMSQSGYVIVELKTKQLTLEDIFLKLTTTEEILSNNDKISEETGVDSNENNDGNL